MVVCGLISLEFELSDGEKHLGPFSPDSFLWLVLLGLSHHSEMSHSIKAQNIFYKTTVG